MPVADQVLGLGRQRVEDAVLRPAGADRVHGDPAAGEAHREIADEGLERRLGRAHPDPGLEAARAAPFGVGDGEDAASPSHERRRLAHADEEGLGLGVERVVPLLQRDVHRRLEEERHLGPGVAHEYVELAEIRPHLAEHLGDLLGLPHVGLHGEALGPAPADLGQRVFRRRLVLVVMDGHLDTRFGQLQRDASADSARASGDQRMSTLQRHVHLLRLEGSARTNARV